MTASEQVAWVLFLDDLFYEFLKICVNRGKVLKMWDKCDIISSKTFVLFADEMDLKALTSILYMQIYSKYQEMEDFTMRLYDQSLELPSDKYINTIEELEEIIEEKNAKINEQEIIIKELQQKLEEMK